MSQSSAALSAGTGSPPVGWTGGVAMILVTLACWTSIPLFLAHFKDLIDPWTANGWRYGFSALMWLPVLVLHWTRKRMPAGLWRAALWPSVFNIGAQICFGLAPYYITPGLMTFCLRLQIVFLTIGAAIMFAPERRVIRSPLFLAGIALLLGGTFLTIGFGKASKELASLSDQALSDTRFLAGVGFSIASGVLYAGYALSVRKRMGGYPAFTAFAAVSQYTGAALVLLMLLKPGGQDLLGASFPNQSVLNLPATQIVLLLVSAVVGIGIGHTLYYSSIQRLGLAVASGVVQLQPITVSLGAYALFGDKLTNLQWITGIAAIAGAVLMLAAQQRDASRHRPAKSTIDR